MQNINSKDFTMRIEDTGSMALATATEHVLNTVQHLMFAVPGRDDMEPELGLNIRNKIRVALAEGERDTDYEQEIARQFLTFTDLAPTSVIAITENGEYHVHLTVSWNNQYFQLQVGQDPATLTIAILPKTVDA